MCLRVNVAELPSFVAGSVSNVGTPLGLSGVSTVCVVQHLLGLGLVPDGRVPDRRQVTDPIPDIGQLRGGVAGVSVAPPDVALHLPVAQTVGGAALVAAGHGRPLALHLADQTLQVVRLAPHLRVGGRQTVVTLTRQTETE